MANKPFSFVPQNMQYGINYAQEQYRVSDLNITGKVIKDISFERVPI